ncbi:hypothetical protein Tco_0736406 [Tanacetum coccineum]
MHDVPLAAFMADGLRVIASKIGNPLMLDSYTDTMCRGEKVQDEGYTFEKVHIEYEWKPSHCLNCKTFCHAAEVCPLVVKTQPKKDVEVQSNGFKTVKGQNKGKKHSEMRYVKNNNPFSVLAKESTSGLKDNEDGNTFGGGDLDTSDLSKYINASMQDFNECISNIEVDDVNSTDHAPVVLKIHRVTKEKPKPFKFFNFLVYKPEFMDVMNENWCVNISGHNMFKLVKKMWCRKKSFCKLLRSQGNLYEKVVRLRHELDEVQKALDKDLYSPILRDEEEIYLSVFTQDTLDLERFLKQKSKID